MNAIEIAATLELKLVPCGSRVTCSPPPIDTDQDYVAFMDRARLGDIHGALLLDGWDLLGSEVCACLSDDWFSYRKGDDNLILIWSQPLYDCFLASSRIARALNLREKTDRVILFQTMETVWPGLARGPITIKGDLEDLFA